MTGLQGRVGIVTGGARGIGQADAIRLAEEGVKVAVFDLEAQKCQDSVDTIIAQGGQAMAVSCDVTDPKSVASAVETVADTWGPITILVNNAGITRDNLIFRMTDEEWWSVVNSHLTGSFNCTRAVQRYMVQEKWGKIVFTSSTSALGNRGQVNYAAAKAGLIGMTRTLAIELGPFNINVNAVAPGFVDTDMTRDTAFRLHKDPEEWKAERAAQIPLRRVGTPRDIANVVAFLCSDDASFVTGQVIYISGAPGRA
ncbi:3-oxoacyl-ACP reductase FabG [Sulfobacillus sp. hq2]|uniref:3-oxoacyl-ACP reductase FabG n=1 Tax=Sulfobacillus sp. hq2 TaxID=2039167 RepID=UPI000CD27A93|nr:3-oxoacyl-ACP reductase FabG [Sulfobacillus sp. hq2]POB11366.1 beta-ketoacyl-ACP reductase [Sulfobacillus sp. hq2]